MTLALLFILLFVPSVFAAQVEPVENKVEVIPKGEMDLGQYPIAATPIAQNLTQVRMYVDLTDIADGTRWAASLLESFDDGVTWTPAPLCKMAGGSKGKLISTVADIGCNLKQVSSQTRQLKGVFRVLQGTANTKVEVSLK